MAIDLMERGELTPTGKGGQLFCGHDWSGENVGLVQSTDARSEFLHADFGLTLQNEFTPSGETLARRPNLASDQFPRGQDV
jgi:hypothetical protein